MTTNKGPKRAVETFLVASGDAALANTASADDPMYDFSTGAVSLADGQLGIVDMSGLGSNTFLDFTDATPTAAESPVIQLVQGNANSADPATAQSNATYPLWARPYEASGWIDSRNYVMATKQDYVAPTSDVWVIGQDIAEASGQIVPNSNTSYQLNIAYRGRIVDEWYSPEAAAHFSPHYITPDYDALGIVTTNNRRDHLIQNLVFVINRNSRAIAMNRTRFKGNDPMIAFAIDSSATAGTALDTLTPGFVPVVNTNLGIRGITLNAGQIANLQAAAAAANFPATSTIATVDLSTAGAATNVCDGIFIMSLDRKTAFKDYIPQVKIRLDIGLTSGFDFNTVYNTREVNATEGEGIGRKLALLYDATHGQRKYQLQHVEDPIINFPNPVNTAGTYTTYVIEHADANQIDTSNVSVSPMREIVLVPSADTTTEGELDTALSAWLASINQTLVTL